MPHMSVARLFRRAVPLVFVASSLVAVSKASAQPTLPAVFDRSLFQSSLFTYGTNNLDALNGQTAIAFAGLGTATLGGGLVVTTGKIVNPNASGTPFTLSLSFSNLINGFGADFTNAFGQGQATFRLFSGATQVGQALGFNSAPFVGVISSVAFNRIEVSEMTLPGNGAPSFSSLDNLAIGTLAPSTTVPEPATVSLLAAGILGLGVMARRRKSVRLA